MSSINRLGTRQQDTVKQESILTTISCHTGVPPAVRQMSQVLQRCCRRARCRSTRSTASGPLGCQSGTAASPLAGGTGLSLQGTRIEGNWVSGFGLMHVI